MKELVGTRAEELVAVMLMMKITSTGHIIFVSSYLLPYYTHTLAPTGLSVQSKKKYCMIIKLISLGDSCMNHCRRWPDDCSKYTDKMSSGSTCFVIPPCICIMIFFLDGGGGIKCPVMVQVCAAANSVNIMYQT